MRWATHPWATRVAPASPAVVRRRYSSPRPTTDAARPGSRRPVLGARQVKRRRRERATPKPKKTLAVADGAVTRIADGTAAATPRGARRRGFVVVWWEGRGYGFLQVDGVSGHVYVNRRQVEIRKPWVKGAPAGSLEGALEVSVGEVVEVPQGQSDNGRVKYHARDVVIVSRREE